MSKNDDVRTKRRAEIAARAAESFKGHILKDEGHGRWYCARPDTCNYSFRVTDFKDGLILSGDIGELLFVVYGRSPISWLRGCLKHGNEDYVLGKIPYNLRQREAIWDLALEFFKDNANDEDENKIASEMCDALEVCADEHGRASPGHGLTEHEWASAFHEAGGCDEPPSVSDWSTHTLIQLGALKWFCAALDAAEDSAGKSEPGKDLRDSPEIVIAVQPQTK